MEPSVTIRTQSKGVTISIRLVFGILLAALSPSLDAVLDFAVNEFVVVESNVVGKGLILKLHHYLPFLVGLRPDATQSLSPGRVLSRSRLCCGR